jgi:hypothetical protein
MEIRHDILNEVHGISPVVANIGNQVPYEVPQGYFEELAGKVIEQVDAGTVDAVYLNIGNQPIYEVPQGYFQELAGKIMDRIKAGDETSLTAGKDNVYEVPEGYFDGFAASMLNKVKALEATSPKEELSFLSPLLNQAEKKTPFAAPDGYFNELANNVVAGVQAIEFVNGELENLSPLMSSLKTKQVFEAPKGYFEQLPAIILSKVKQPAGKVVSMSFGKRVMRYAAAAVVIGLVAIGGWMISKQGNIVPETAKVDVPKVVKTATDEELINSAENIANATILADVNTVSADAEEDAKDLFANVTDDELQKYLEEHGSVAVNNPVTN